MKIKRVVATVAILGGLASLAYAQRPSVICPVHGVSGRPTGATINDKGQCEYEHEKTAMKRFPNPVSQHFLREF